MLYKYKCVSEDALRMTVTVRPQGNEWNELNNTMRFSNLMKTWTLYQDELMRLIGYENREDMVFIEGATTGSITYYLLVDLLPTEDANKVSHKIEKALAQKSRVFTLVSHNIFRKGKVESTSPSSASANSENKVFIAVIAILSVILCILVVVMLKRYFAARSKVT